jgi:glutamine amidotransferase-like uncharacterized protein
VTCRAGFVWETPQHFNRFLTDCGITCELVTPHMLAAPFWRPTFNCLVIPTGFGNPAYSGLLPALRASSPRIRRFVENGGNVLVFGAAADKPDAYDWLPFSLTYRHEYRPRSVTCAPASDAGMLVEDYDQSCIECDGSFPSHEGTPVGHAEQHDVIIEKKIGKGRIVVTCIHEFPSKNFIRKFCSEGTPTSL